jgi:UDP:flavonoid glycosyltransferase YjiC (YdhE family)
MLAMPQAADQFLNAHGSVEHGLGVRLLPEELSPAAVREAVRELVDDPRYRETVCSHRPAIGAMPSPEEVVAVLQETASPR